MRDFIRQQPDPNTERARAAVASFEAEVAAIFAGLSLRQERMDARAEEAIFDNLEEMYEA